MVYFRYACGMSVISVNVFSPHCVVLYICIYMRGLSVMLLTVFRACFIDVHVYECRVSNLTECIQAVLWCTLYIWSVSHVGECIHAFCVWYITYVLETSVVECIHALLNCNVCMCGVHY